MCGIIGYIGNKDAVPILIDGLKRLEYRGYDSAGICVQSNQGLRVIKSKGKISSLEEKLTKSNLIKSTAGIAHTRWATHGEPSELNAHPHTDFEGKIAVVHNGIIENYAALKKILENEGVKFVSQTDSEVLAHLISKFYEGDLTYAVQKAIALIEGTFGIAVMSKSDNVIVVARKSSPLVIGMLEDEMFVASDLSAILPFTNKVLYLNDGEIAILKQGYFELKDFDGVKLKNEFKEINQSIEQIQKGNYAHFMLKEIFEQPESIKNVLAGRLKDEKIKLSIDVNFADVERIIIIGCGTSFHSGLIGKYLLEKIVNIPVEVNYASEFRYGNTPLSNTDLVVVISQSGETADTLAALRKAKQFSAKTLGIVNVVASTIAREVDSGIYLHCGPEMGVASTKAFTSQVIALLLLAKYFAQEKGIKSNDLIELHELATKVSQTLGAYPQIKNISKQIGSCRQFLYLGRGINFPVALEGALKLKEVSYVSAEGLPAAEMKHGPIALIDDSVWSIFIATENELLQKTLSNIQEIKARNGKIIAITNSENEDVSKLADVLISVPKVPEELEPIINVIPLQLLAYQIALDKGLDVDKPRNLAKSVTVE
jgi:glucosamine--fructose-6-phosphate aminotransferase (isomerizing)